MGPEPNDAWRCTVTAALLRQGRLLAAMSQLLLMLTLATLGLSLAAGRPLWALPCALSLAAGVITQWLSLRVGLDADLFEALARDSDLAGFDRAMTSLGLMPQDRAGRPLQDRVEGAMHLLKAQGLALAVQFLCLAAGAFAVYAVGG